MQVSRSTPQQAALQPVETCVNVIQPHVLLLSPLRQTPSQQLWAQALLCWRASNYLWRVEKPKQKKNPNPNDCVRAHLKTGPHLHQQHGSHVSLLVIINHPRVILTSWTNKPMEYVSGSATSVSFMNPRALSPLHGRGRAKKALQPIKKCT